MIDAQSETWLILQKFAEDQQRLIVLRLMDPTAAHEATQYYRGQLNMLRRVLALAMPEGQNQVLENVDVFIR